MPELGRARRRTWVSGHVLRTGGETESQSHFFRKIESGTRIDSTCFAGSYDILPENHSKDLLGFNIP